MHQSIRILAAAACGKVLIPHRSNLGHPCSAIQPPLLAPRSGVAPKYSSCLSMAYFVPLSTSQGRDARNFGMPPSISGLFSHSSLLFHSSPFFLRCMMSYPSITMIQIIQHPLQFRNHFKPCLLSVLIITRFPLYLALGLKPSRLVLYRCTFELHVLIISLLKAQNMTFFP